MPGVQGGAFAGRGCHDGFATVSYTHLDVYKRQHMVGRFPSDSGGIVRRLSCAIAGRFGAGIAANAFDTRAVAVGLRDKTLHIIGIGGEILLNAAHARATLPHQLV